MGLNLHYEYGQTPLDAKELTSIKIGSISTKAELDQFEQQNIEQAMLWVLNKNWNVEKVLTEAFIKDLHRRMFINVWRWAGVFRRTEKNIGVLSYQIPTALRQLLDDARFWYSHQIFEPDEMALRFKHRLVSIHCFANGNGRHSRLMADIVMEKLFDLPVFSWGRDQAHKGGSAVRKDYISSLRAADIHRIKPLLAFARS